LAELLLLISLLVPVSLVVRQRRETLALPIERAGSARIAAGCRAIGAPRSWRGGAGRILRRFIRRGGEYVDQVLWSVLDAK